MENLNNFNTITVIDFETASPAYFSACAIGIALISGDKIVDKQYYLIQPPDNYYHKDNIAIHGITPEQTQDAEPFNILWVKIKHYFENTYVAAHNANFDMSTLKATLDYYDIEQPCFEYMDSIQVSGRGISYGEKIEKNLAARCSYFDIELNNHHNALCDAEAAANLILCAFKSNRYKTLSTFIKMSVNLNNYDDVKLKKTFGLSKFRKIDVKEIAATVIPSDIKDDDFNRKIFVFTGELKKLTREQALAKVIAGGGTVKNTITKKVNILVNADVVVTAKVKAAMDLQASGNPIKIVTEEQFMAMLECNSAIEI